MIIDCARCSAYGRGCDGCVMQLMFARQSLAAPGGAEQPAGWQRLTVDERRAVAVLVAAGLVDRDVAFGKSPESSPRSRLAG